MNKQSIKPDLKIGDHFYIEQREFRVTDLGTRTIIAIPVDDAARKDPSILSGPPYYLAEMGFDEDDFPVMKAVNS